MMKTHNYFRSLQATVAIAALASVSLFPLSEALAETPGTLGPTSTGTVLIEVTKPAAVMITGLSDMIVQNWTVTSSTNYTPDAFGTQNLDTTACLYSTGATTASAGDYALTITAANGSGPTFYLQDNSSSNTGAAYQIPYYVKWHAGGVGTSGTFNGTAYTDGQTQDFTGGDTISSSCSDGSGANVQLNIQILATDLEAAGVSTFSDTLTLLVAPN